MNNENLQQDRPETQAPVVTFSSIPLDEEPATPVGFDSLPPDAPGEVHVSPQITVVDVQFKKGGKIYYFNPGDLDIPTGEEVIIETARGPEYGFCTSGNHSIPKALAVAPLRSVLRIATEADKETRASYKKKEFEALALCQQKIAEHKLDMKLVSAEYSFDGSKILFYFTADGRVDFRDLVKDLAGIFRTRIELRQIGVRDEAKMLGGLGVCGRPFCCKQFLDDFQPVSIKMAKTQSLSLNPTKISGTCGRLMCCLKYEQDAYESLIKSSPKNESLVNTYDGVGTVTETNLLKQTVKVRLEQDPSTLKTYNNSEILVLRNGKARKTDPPIDTNIPPLPRPERPPEEEEITLFDESKLSNYTAGDAARAAERAQRSERRRTKASPSDGGEAQEQRDSHSRSKNRSRSRNRNRASESAQTSAPERAGDRIVTKPQSSRKQSAKPEQKDVAEKKESGKSRNNRRRYYRGRKSSDGSAQS